MIYPRIIAHRGNLFGPSPYENKPSHIMNAISEGFDVEIDVWYIDDQIWFGHDYPQYLVRQNILNKIVQYAWLHCKNIEAAQFFSNHFMSPNFFWHENDTITITSHKYLWTYPGAELTNKSIAVMPELAKQEFKTLPFGICTDYAVAFKELLN